MHSKRTMKTKEKIIKILTQAFKTEVLKIVDDSAKHTGHREAEKSGGGHFSVVVVSDDFQGKNLIARHRMIYGALKNEMDGDIHAMAIQSFTLKEYQSRA